MRIQADLVDQLFNSSEKRFSADLLIMRNSVCRASHIH